MRFLVNTFFSKKLDFRIRLFNVMGMAGTVIGLLMALVGALAGASLMNIIVNIGSSALGLGLLYYTYRSGRYQLGYMIVIIVIFLVAFPILFFSAGGFNSGMPSFFIFAVLFTVLMLKGKWVFIMAALEISLYTGICLFAYGHPESVAAFATEADVMTDIIAAFVAVSVILGVTMFLHFRIYDAQQRELETARQRLSDDNAALERLDRLKTEFLANVSHELKTPLTVVSSYAQSSEMQLAAQPENGALAEKMKIIASEADRLALMVEQILDITRIEEGRMIYAFDSCRIEEIITTAVETHFPILNKNGDRLVLSFDSYLPKIRCDASRLKQVIVNLIANAIRFTRNGVVTISACQDGSFIKISIADTGAGIEPERLPTIFDRFNRANKPGDGDTGTGLGLYICRNIIDAHGGSIAVESTPGKGTTVCFTVPMA